MDAVAEEHELFQPCVTFPRGPLDLEQLQSQAEIVTERAPDRSQGGNGHTEFSLYCICLPDSRVQDLLAGESKRGGCKFITQSRRKCSLFQSTRQLVLSVKLLCTIANEAQQTAVVTSQN